MVLKDVFILDSGASNTCVGIEWITYFNLEAEDSEIKAAGAGASAMETQVANKKSLRNRFIKYSQDSFSFI